MGVYSFPSSVSFPNPLAPHFLSEMGSLYIPSLVIILILVNIWILFSKLPTIYEKHRNKSIIPPMAKVINCFHFLGPLPNDFLNLLRIKWQFLWALLCNTNLLFGVNVPFPLNYITA